MSGTETPSRWAVRGSRLLVGALAIFAATFLFRFLTVDFPNDHFVHLSRARQILLGDVPVRDFFDPGLFLQYYASALALALSGGTLLGEAILTVFCIALGAALTFFLAARVTSSIPIGLVGASIAAATVPRLYNYPKVFLYVLALTSVWHYVRRPGTGSLVLLGLVTALAFLFRHDHGVYIGLSLVTGLIVLHWTDRRQLSGVLTRYALVTLLLILPWALFVQSSGGLWHYFRGSLPQAQDATTPRLNWLPLGIAPLSSWVSVDPPAERRVFVRWASQADAATRRAKEIEHGLLKEDSRDAQTSSYVLASEQPDRIRALVEDPAVEDTHGIDRATFRINLPEPLFERLGRQIGVLRLRLSPTIVTDDTAVAWLYYLTLFLPAVAIWLLIAGSVRGRIPRSEAALLSATIVLCLVIGQGLVRDFPRARLPDVAAPTAVLGAWIIGLWVRPKSDSRVRSVRTRRIVAVLVGLVTLWSAGTVGRAGELLHMSGLLTPLTTPSRLAGAARQLSRRPIDVFTESHDTGIHGLTRYVLDCTAPSDRLLVTWFEPEVFFYAERAFAGGQVYLYGDWHASPQDQRLTIERMSRQRVPVILVNSSLANSPFRTEFPLVYDFVGEHYTVAAEGTFGSDQVFSVLTDRRITPTGTYSRFGLPCFR